MYNNQSYPTSEHLYQALKFKCETTEEKEWREIIRNASTPGIAKHLGHFTKAYKYEWQKKITELINKYENKVRLNGDFNDDNFKLSVMRIALRCKYENSKEFRDALIKSGYNKLMEDTQTDWGWKKGWLGMLLEELRDQQK